MTDLNSRLNGEVIRTRRRLARLPTRLLVTLLIDLTLNDRGTVSRMARGYIRDEFAWREWRTP